VGAAVLPAALIVTGCSGSGSGSDSGTDTSAKASDAPSAPESKAPTAAPAKYAKLPSPCKVLSKKALGTLVPKGTGSAKEGSSDDISSRGSCSWNSLDNNGVKGSQFRWLNISLLRFDSDTARGSAEKQAHDYYGDQVKDARSVEGAANTKSTTVSTGDEAMAVRYDLKKKEATFKQQTVVARVENVVVTLDYNGAGLAGDKTPDPDTLTKNAVSALKDVVAGVTKANATSGSSSSASPSQSAKAAS
jgi:Protein of unknown function (DUF3558)